MYIPRFSTIFYSSDWSRAIGIDGNFKYCNVDKDNLVEYWPGDVLIFAMICFNPLPPSTWKWKVNVCWRMEINFLMNGTKYLIRHLTLHSIHNLRKGFRSIWQLQQIANFCQILSRISWRRLNWHLYYNFMKSCQNISTS